MGLYVILIGVQGAGKGVQASFIRDTFNIPHISTGDLFRAMKTRTDELAQQVQALMKAGQLISDDVTNAIVKDRLGQPDAANGVILDGYPRNKAQADYLADLLAQRGEAINAVLLLNLDLFTAFKRAFGRVTDADGNSYNIYSTAQPLQVTFDEDPAGKFPPRIVAMHGDEILQRRPDDANAAAIIKRIDTYLDTTQPLIDYYSQRELLFTIDASKSIDAVSQEIRAVLDRVKKS